MPWTPVADLTGPPGLDGNGYVELAVPAGSTSPVLTHELGTRAIDVTVFEVGAGGVWLQVPVAYEPISTSQVRLTFIAAPTTGQYRALLIAGAPVSAQLIPVPPVDLVDAATIGTDPGDGVHFILAAMGGPTRTLGAPGAGVGRGQRVLWELTATAACTVTLAAGAGGFEPTAAAPDDVVPVPAGRTLLVGAIWSAARSRWTVLAATVTE